MNWCSLAGQGEEFGGLLARARALRMPHALLLEGPSGIGKSRGAIALAASLLCGDDAATSGACGSCPACKKVSSEQHPDLHMIAPPEDKRVIPVEMVRGIRARLELAPVEGRARVVVIDPADRLNEQGQNALLKTLEEPGIATFLLLAARRPEGLLPTVRSRIARYRVRPLSAEALARDADLTSVDRGMRDRAIAASCGSLGQARAFAASAEMEGVLANVEAGRVSPLAAAKQALAGAEGRIEVEDRARSLLRWCGARCRAGLEASFEGLSASSLASSSGGAYFSTSHRWTHAAEAVFEAEADLAIDIPVPQVLAEFFLRWTETVAGTRVRPTGRR